MGTLETRLSSGPLKHLLTCTVYYSDCGKDHFGSAPSPSQGDVKEPESCLSEALLTADLCVFSHLSCRALGVRACVLGVKNACLRATQCIWLRACKRDFEGSVFVIVLRE